MSAHLRVKEPRKQSAKTPSFPQHHHGGVGPPITFPCTPEGRSDSEKQRAPHPRWRGSVFSLGTALLESVNSTAPSQALGFAGLVGKLSPPGQHPNFSRPIRLSRATPPENVPPVAFVTSGDRALPLSGSDVVLSTSKGLGPATLMHGLLSKETFVPQRVR